MEEYFKFVEYIRIVNPFNLINIYKNIFYVSIICIYIFIMILFKINKKNK